MGGVFIFVYIKLPVILNSKFVILYTITMSGNMKKKGFVCILFIGISNFQFCPAAVVKMSYLGNQNWAKQKQLLRTQPSNVD